jgi:hypothetical protein
MPESLTKVKLDAFTLDCFNTEIFYYLIVLISQLLVHVIPSTI